MSTQSLRRATGVAMMIASLALGVLAPFAASAQEAPEEPESTEIAVERSGFWNGRVSETLPSALTKSFPPEALCLVEPAACNTDNEQVNEVIDAVDGALTGAVSDTQENDPGAPADAVPPDTYPVSVFGGQAYYRSALQLELPPLPEGEQADDFLLVLTETDPTFNFASPALRQAVLAALTCARETDTGLVQGRCEQEEFEKVLSEGCTEDSSGPCVDDGLRLGIEACPIVDDPTTDVDGSTWEEGRSQNETTLPEVDCLFGALGEQVETADGVLWVFDLTIARQAWADGQFPNNGVLLRPQAAENFAFGDVETTFNKQVTFAPVVMAAQSSSVPPPPPEPLPVPPPPPPASTGGASGTPFAAPTSMGQFGTGTAPPPATGTSAPTTAPDTTPAATPAAPAAPQQPLAALPTEPAGATGDWLVWLLALPFALGAWLYSRSLGEPVVAAAAARSGAMSRLLELRAAERQPDLVGG